MSTTRLPELPTASYESAYDDAPLTDHYSANQMHVYGLAVWKAAMQRAVEVAGIHAALPEFASGYERGYCDASNVIADTLAGLPLPELAGSPQERRE